MTNKTPYTPHFYPDEFRALTNHYKIKLGGKQLMYTYIRKNACSTFKSIINQTTHVKYRVKNLLGLEPNLHDHISGNMKYYSLSEPISERAFDATIFVYRDPRDRLISTYLNKFVACDGAIDIKNSYEKVTGKAFDMASFQDFLNYVSKTPFADIDPHLWPQKSHLREATYSHPIQMNALEPTMATILGPANAKRHFARLRNASGHLRSSQNTEGSLEKMDFISAEKLRRLVKRGHKISTIALASDSLGAVAMDRYSSDYQMIEVISGRL